MSSTIEERVVGLKFDNSQFQQGIQATLASLENLNKGLKLDGATKGLNDLNAAGKNVQLGHIAGAVDGIADRFKAMSIVGITAIASITNQAIQSGLQLAKSLTVAPINSGLQEYQTNINSIQTILSNTRWQNTGLDDVNLALSTLNEYSDKTIYNFSQMARNIGTFTAAGVKLDVATNAIKGIANLAAVSGSNAEQASSAMYQLSQALATGTVRLIDWNSVNAAGIGGKVFQDAIIETARVHGVSIDEMIKSAGSFRATLEEGWFTSDILTETLQKFTGDLTREQIISMGYTEDQATAIMAMGQDATDAAQKVKTISQLFGTLQESAGSGWAKTWQTIFGDFEEARTLFTSVNDTLGEFIKGSADARNKVLADWKELGGRTQLINAAQNAFQALLAIMRPIGEAFRSIFPALTGERLAELTTGLSMFTAKLLIGAETADKIKRTFAGVFAVFGIGIDLLKGFIGVFGEMFGIASEGAGGFLDTTASIGDFLVALRIALRDGGGLIKFFQGVETVLRPIALLIRWIGNVFREVFGGIDVDTTAAAQSVNKFVKNLGPLGVLVDFVAFVWRKMIGIFDNVAEFFAPLAVKFQGWFKDISDAVGGINFQTLLNALNTGALIGLVVVIRNSLGRGGISGVLGELTDTLGAMQTTLQATTLLEIALAVGILAVSISILSKIDSEKLAVALSAIGIMFVQLLAALAILSRMPDTNVLKLYVQAAALTVLAIAINILAIAVKSLSELSWEELIKGLIGVSVLLLAITVSARMMPPSGMLVATGLSLLILSAGIKVLASAVADLSGLSWEEMVKGLAGVGALLLELTLFSRFAGANAAGVLGGAGILLIAVAIKILASAITDLSSISWENIGKGLLVLALSLEFMVGALDMIPPTAPLSAAGVAIVAASILILAEAFKSIAGISWENVTKGLIVMAGSLAAIGIVLEALPPTAAVSALGIAIVAGALIVISQALQQFGNMNDEQIIKSMIVLAGSLLIIAVALDAMLEALPGAFAVLVVAGALAILTPVLITLGNMSWGEIVKGLVALAGVFLVIGLASALLTPAIIPMIGLGVALLFIGAGLALAGAGLFLFSLGLAALSVSGAVGVAAIVAILTGFIGLIPVFVQQLGIAILLLIDVLIEGIPKIVEFLIKLIIQLLDGLEEILPKLAIFLLKLIATILLILIAAIPQMVEAGYKIMIGILEGIRDNIQKVVETAAEVIIAFLRGIGNSIPGIIQAGVDLILSFVRGLTEAINNNAEAMGNAGADLAIAIINGMVRGLSTAGGRVADAAREVARKALNGALSFLGINSPSKEFIKVGRYSDEGFAVGLDKNAGLVERSAEGVGNTAMEALRGSLSNFADLLKGDIDLTPTITPVLDLSSVRKDAGTIGSLLSTKPLLLDATYSSARSASAGYQNNKDMADENAMSGPDVNVEYNQYNSSPKALSEAEIYRNTNNQLSTLKGGLPV